MFTDRFIKVPTKIYETKYKEITGEEGDLEDSWSKILPMAIVEYRPTTADDCECTHVFLNNGNTILTYMPIEQFEKLLNEHQK